MKILLIEDDLVDRMTIERLFKKNYLSNRLEVVENGAEALTLLQEKNRQSLTGIPEHLLIFLDLYLPKMDGLEFLTKLRSDFNLKNLPVVVLVTSPEERHRLETYQLNIAGYLRKPFNFSEFTQLMVTLNKNGVFELRTQAI